MSDSSPRLSLPYIQPSQAQKHVTHNEALRVLDAATQLAVLAADVIAPPPSPVSGDCYLVGDGASGEWAGRDGQVAIFDGAAWAYFQPRQGWHADVAPEGRLLRYDGAAWVDAVSFQNLAVIGVQTSANAANRLAVSSQASLFTHQGAGHQLKINKASASDTASVLFQTNWSGRAEFGTAGNDDFSIKVSPDGATFRPAMVADKTTGAVRFPSGQTYFVDVSLANDTAFALDIPWSDPARILLWLATDQTGHFALVAVTGVMEGATNFAPISMQPAGSVTFHTGPLTGTTGPAGAINLSIDTSLPTKRLIIENRLGAQRQVTLATLGR